VTLRIERASAQGRTIVRLIGRVQSESLTDLKIEIDGPQPQVTLDLGEVTLVDIGVVRFLIACEERGVELLHCSPYIRQWMVSERPAQ
jgi:hypothetical protein